MNAPETQREAFTIAIEPGLWRGFDVTVSPPTIAHSPRHFRDRAAAMAFAEELARVTGWPMKDRVGGAA